jgi:hypothetical protein
MNPSIYNMTHQQYRLAELMWNLTPTEIYTFFRALPTEYRQDAVLVYEIMVLETIDHEIQGEQDVTQAAKLLRQFSQAAW